MNPESAELIRASVRGAGAPEVSHRAETTEDLRRAGTLA